MTKGLNIVSRLTFENIPDGTLPASIPDENQYSNYSYTKVGTVTVEAIDEIKFIKLNSTTAKIYSPFIISDQSKKHFQAEFDVIFDSIKADTHLVSIGTNALANALRVVASNNPAQGLRLINGNNQISSYYRFENNKKYTICVGFKDNVISMYVNGTIIGYFYSEEFINSLNVTTPSNIILGAPLNNTNDANLTLYGKLGNINISSGPSVKHEESYTKYGTNLVSFLNFQNLAAMGTYKTGIEAVYKGLEWRGVESATYSNRYGNIKNISTDLTSEFTVTFSLKKFKVANANILKYGNYSVDYAAGFIPVPEPDVEVNEYTTSALNFENGLVDQIGTTIWQKEGTADITSVNKIFGENSFETKALGDSLYTNSNVITGGATPFTIEFYNVLNPDFSTTAVGTDLSLYAQPDSQGYYQGLFVTKETRNVGYYRNGTMPNLVYTTLSSYKINVNDVNKYTITYDGAAIRVFVNDKLENIIGSGSGHIITNQPFQFLSYNFNTSKNTTLGIIDNINIHDGIATKVRDPDPYEEYLVVDLAFDGENNSTKIVDNAGLTERNEIKYNDNIVSLIKPTNNGITDDLGNNWLLNGTTFGPGVFDYQAITNGSISCQDNGKNVDTWIVFYQTVGSLDFYIKRGNSQNESLVFSYWATNIRWRIFLSNTKLRLDVYIGASNTIYFELPAKTNNFELFSLVRHTDNTWELFVDGVSCGKSGVFTGITYSGSGSSLIIDTSYGTNQISLVRFIRDRDTYKSNFVPPTLPFKYIPINKWTVIGSAKISTIQKFDGFSSLYVDSGGMSRISSNLSLNLIKDFTISFEFIKENDVAAAFFDTRASTSDYTNAILITFPSVDSNSINVYMNGLDNTWSVSLNSGTFIELNKKYKVDIICKSNNLQIFVNGILKASQQYDFDVFMDIDSRYSTIGKNINGTGGNLQCYIKNFKIYKGVAVIPEDPTGKIQLDFDNNFNDKYGNSTWTNNGVTFDQVNSVKGHAAYFNSNSKITNTDNKFNANRSDFILSLNMMPKSGRGQYAEFIASSETSYPVEGSSYISCFDNGLIRTASYLNGVDTSFGGFNIKDDIYYKIDIIRKNGIMYHVLNDVYRESCNLDTISSYSNLPKFNFNAIGKAGWNANNIGYKGYLDNVRLVKSNILNKFIVASNNNDSPYICSYSNKSFGFKDTKANASTKYYLAECPKLTDFIIETDFYYNSNSQIAIIFNGESFIDSNLVNAWGNIIYFENGSFGFGFGSGHNFSSIVSPQAHGIEYKSDARLKIIKNGLNVKLYINDILKLDTNCYYNDRSYIGIRTYSASTTNVSEINMFRNFTVKDVLDESIIYELNDNEQTIDNNNNNINIHIPFEGSTSNIGYNNVNVITSGNPIYSNEYKAIKIENNNYVYIQPKSIFNVGSNHDFFIGMEIMIISMKNYNFILCNHNSYNNNLLFDMYVDSNGRINIRSGSNSPYYIHQNELTINHFYSIALIRDKGNFYLSIDGELTKIQNKHINFSHINLYIGASGWLGSTDFLNGYIRNFKFNLGSSIIPEAYNQHTVLNLDFKPTGKSYLFKDNNNKCVIHPVNITQRDYQDSQYCCTFNGTNQYLELGKLPLLNFGLDDCVIEVIFKPKTQSAEWGTLIGHNMPSATSMDFLMVTRDGTIACRINNLGLTINTNIKVVYNEINKLLFIRNNKNITIKLNDVVIYDAICEEPFNLNKNDNTYIGRNGWDGANGYFCGTIYSIKILRNTTDLSLLEDENTNVIIGDTTLTLSNGTDSQEVIFDNKDQNDFRFVHSNDSTKLIVNEQILEVPNVENESNELSLFTDFNAEVKDIKTYNIAFEDEDTFSGNVPIHTQFGEIEEISTLSDDFIVVDQGDFIVNGFFEGRPEDSRYQIQNRFDKFIVHTGSGQFNYNGLNERFIDDYEIYLPDTKETMSIPTEPMIRGYITISITPTECEGVNFGVKVFRRSDNKLIGIYDFNNYVCTIDNLDCNKRYDCIIFDKDVNIESRCLSNRTPLPY